MMRFGVDGVEHGHVAAIARGLVAAGGVGAFVAGEGSGAEALAREFGVSRDRRLDAVDLLVAGGVPAHRAAVAHAAMRAGKDVICPKPAVLTVEALDALERTHRETGRFFTIWFSERLASPSTTRAVELVRAGRIGRVVHVVGLAPHQRRAESRAPWFWDPRQAGGLLIDLASHQFDQFLTLTGETTAVQDAWSDNVATPQWPSFRDIAGCTVRTPGGVTGQFRVDWLYPDSAPLFGDLRLFVQGTLGSIEVRKTLDAGGMPGGDHLLLTDATGVVREQVSAAPDFFVTYLDDLVARTERAVAQTHVFQVCRLALAAQAFADG